MKIGTSRLIVVTGPPCAGKSTHVRATGAAYLDWDERYAETAGLPLHVRAHNDAQVLSHVERSFRRDVEDAARRETPTFVIRGAPQRWLRAMYRRRFGADVIVLEVPEEECLRRLHASERAREVWPATEAAIRGWWNHYERSCKDVVLQPEWDTVPL